jgi:polysaccharide pyruvyl transferase WcaK-like protein
MKQVPSRIGLLDHLGHGNLGDEATLTVAMSQIRLRCPEAQLAGLSLNPTDTLKRHGIPAYAIRRDSKVPPQPVSAPQNAMTRKGRIKRSLSRYPTVLKVLQIINAILITRPRAVILEICFLIESYAVVRRLDLLVVCGGGQLLDSWGGPWSFPWTLLKWVALAKIARTKIYFINVGAGPLRFPLSRQFIRIALKLSDYVSFRDEDSQRLVWECGFHGRSEVRPDNVYALDVSGSRRSNQVSTGRGVVAMSPMIYCDPRVYWEKDQSVYEGLIRKLAALGAWLIENDHSLALFSSDTRIDLPAIADLYAAVKEIAPGTGDLGVQKYAVQTTEEFLSNLSSADFLVTCRFHGVVFAHLLNKPVLALSHHPKVTKLMSDFGLSEFCLDIRNCDAQLLIETFTRLVNNQDSVRARIAAQKAPYRDLLNAQFDQLFHQQSFFRPAIHSILGSAGTGENAR